MKIKVKVNFVNNSSNCSKTEKNTTATRYRTFQHFYCMFFSIINMPENPVLKYVRLLWNDFVHQSEGVR